MTVRFCGAMWRAWLYRIRTVAAVWFCGVGGAVLLAGCAATDPHAPPEGLAYLIQSARGHWQLLRAARPIDDWLADPATPAALRARLSEAQRMRRFATQVLALPDNASYTRYADLGRTAVVWNVVATPELSLQLHSWCYPVLGCVGYRGYFDERHAQAEAERLRAQGLEAAVYPVPAYSTLGWSNAVGGDPLLNTMLAYPSGEVARLLFHELAHQRLYVADDTEFNESFATAVEQLGGQRWLAEQADASTRAAWETFDARRRAFRQLTGITRENLKQIYASPLDSVHGCAIEIDDCERQERRQAKQREMAAFHQRYAELRAAWGGYTGYDAWVARSNNATFAVQGVYDRWVPAFLQLFAQQGPDPARFYDAAAALAALPRAQRDDALARLMPTGSAAPQGGAPSQP